MSAITGQTAGPNGLILYPGSNKEIFFSNLIISIPPPTSGTSACVSYKLCFTVYLTVCIQ